MTGTQRRQEGKELASRPRIIKRHTMTETDAFVKALHVMQLRTHLYTRFHKYRQTQIWYAPELRLTRAVRNTKRPWASSSAALIPHYSGRQWPVRGSPGLRFLRRGDDEYQHKFLDVHSSAARGPPPGIKVHTSLFLISGQETDRIRGRLTELGRSADIGTEARA